MKNRTLFLNEALVLGIPFSAPVWLGLWDSFEVCGTAQDCCHPSLFFAGTREGQGRRKPPGRRLPEVCPCFIWNKLWLSNLGGVPALLSGVPGRAGGGRGAVAARCPRPAVTQRPPGRCRGDAGPGGPGRWRRRRLRPRGPRCPARRGAARGPSAPAPTSSSSWSSRTSTSSTSWGCCSSCTWAPASPAGRPPLPRRRRRRRPPAPSRASRASRQGRDRGPGPGPAGRWALTAALPAGGPHAAGGAGARQGPRRAHPQPQAAAVRWVPAPPGAAAAPGSRGFPPWRRSGGCMCVCVCLSDTRRWLTPTRGKMTSRVLASPPCAAAPWGCVKKSVVSLKVFWWKIRRGYLFRMSHFEEFGRLTFPGFSDSLQNTGNRQQLTGKNLEEAAQYKERTRDTQTFVNKLWKSNLVLVLQHCGNE